MKPHTSRYNCAIHKELAVFLKKVETFSFQLRCSKEAGFHCVGSFAILRLGGSCGVLETSCGVWGTGCGSLTAVRHANKRHCHPLQKLLQGYQGKVKAFSTLAQTQHGIRMSLTTRGDSVKQGGSCGIHERDSLFSLDQKNGSTESHDNHVS